MFDIFDLSFILHYQLGVEEIFCAINLPFVDILFNPISVAVVVELHVVVYLVVGVVVSWVEEAIAVKIIFLFSCLFNHNSSFGS